MDLISSTSVRENKKDKLYWKIINFIRSQQRVRVLMLEGTIVLYNGKLFGD